MWLRNMQCATRKRTRGHQTSNRQFGLPRLTHGDMELENYGSKKKIPSAKVLIPVTVDLDMQFGHKRWITIDNGGKTFNVVPQND
jgi:hypothetical protein